MKLSPTRYRKNGFTVVELIVIIVVIGILAGISIVGYSGLQERSRDAERKADIESIQSVLETYRDQTGEYPNQEQAITNGETFFDDQRLTEAALVAPKATSGTTSSLIWGATTDVAEYGYQSFKGDGTDCLTAPDLCTKYSLSYKPETNLTVLTILSKYGQS
jgi:Tfp pilus assembly protein PilE